MVTRQWATKFMFSFKFYSQCALNLSYIIATETGVRSWLLASQCIKTQGFRLSGALCRFILPSRSKPDCTFYKKLGSKREYLALASVWHHLTHLSSRLHPQPHLVPPTTVLSFARQSDILSDMHLLTSYFKK